MPHIVADVTSTRPLLVVIGPSGSGKSTAVRELARQGVLRVHPTWTTRPRRDDETDGSLEHRFVGADEFERRRDDGFFVDTVQMFGLPYWYGLPVIDRGPADVRGPVDTVMFRAPLVPLLRVHYRDLLVYQIDADPTLVATRLAARGCSADELAARTADNEVESRLGRAVADRRFENGGDLRDLLDELTAALDRDLTIDLADRTLTTAAIGR